MAVGNFAMDAQKGEVSHIFREIADILETFERAETDLDVTHATPVNDNLLDTETASVEVGTRIPFLEDGLESAGDAKTGISLTPTNASLDSDGSLHVELEVTAQCSTESVIGEDATEAEPDRTTEPDSVSDDELSATEQTSGDGSPKPTATKETDTTDKKQTARSNDEITDDAVRANGTSSDSTETGSTSQELNEDEDNEGDPAYRDPERLREVYDKYDTFEEMTDALDVDVTSQTVRRYMIKYDIHSPASETGSHSAEVLLDMDPDSVTTETSDGKAKDDEDTTHPSTRQTPTFQKPT